MIDSFVYCWTDKLTNKLYVGSHKGETTDGYICSSKSMLEQYKKRPNDFSRQIISEGIYSDIRKLEEKILDSLNVREDKMFYNQHNGNGNFYNKGGHKSPRKGIPRTEIEKKAISKGTKKHMNNLQLRKKLSEKAKIRANTVIGKEKLLIAASLGGLSHIGNTHTKESKEKMASVAINNWKSGKYLNRKPRIAGFWWNNGIINKRIKNCPGSEWSRGMLVRKANKNIGVGG